MNPGARNRRRARDEGHELTLGQLPAGPGVDSSLLDVLAVATFFALVAPLLVVLGVVESLGQILVPSLVVAGAFGLAHGYSRFREFGG